MGHHAPPVKKSIIGSWFSPARSAAIISATTSTSMIWRMCGASRIIYWLFQIASVNPHNLSVMETVLLVGLFLGLWDPPHGLGGARPSRDAIPLSPKIQYAISCNKISKKHHTQNKTSQNKTKQTCTSSSKHTKHSTKGATKAMTSMNCPPNCKFYATLPSDTQGDNHKRSIGVHGVNLSISLHLAEMFHLLKVWGAEIGLVEPMTFGNIYRTSFGNNVCDVLNLWHLEMYSTS